MISSIYRTARQLPTLFLVFVLFTATAIEATLAPPALAQDWDVKRNPFDRSLINRYKSILRKRPNDKAARNKLSRMYRRYSSIDRLVREFEKELAASTPSKPTSFSLHVILGHLEQERGKSTESLAHFEKAAQLKPNDPGVQIALGDMFAKSAQTDQAKAAYERALPLVSDKPRKIKIRRALAEIALTTGDIDSAIDHYQKYFVLDPKNVQAQIDLGDALTRHQRHQAAIAVYREAEKRLRTDPTLRVQAVARIGQAFESDGKPDDAVREYRRAIGMVPRGYYLTRELTERIIGIYRERQQLAELLVSFEKDWSVARRGHFEWDVIARLYEETGNQDKALVAYRQATKKSPYELDTQRRLINLLETSGRDKEALRQYETVIRVAPGEPRFQLDLAQRYWRVNESAKALALLKKIERRFVGDPGVFATLAELYNLWGKPDLALAAYKKLTSIEPNDPKHLVNLGEQYYQRDQKQKALAIWKRMIRSKDAASYAALGRVYAEHDLGPEALTAFSKAISLESKTSRHYQGRARVFERLRRYPQAVADWESVLKYTPIRAANQPARKEARRKIVSLLHRGSRRTLAKRVSQWAKAFAPSPPSPPSPPDINAGYFLVESYLRLGQEDKAKATLERLLEHNTKDTVAMGELVKIYREQRDFDKAVALLKRLLEIRPHRARDYYTQIAEIMTAQRRDDEAVRYSQKALDKSPNDPTAHLELAKRYVEMTQYDKAISEYELTLKFDPRNTQASFALASLYGFKNLRDKEAHIYTDVLRRTNDDDVLLRAGRLAINLAEMTDKLGPLEHTLAPLAFTFAHKPIYRRILVELYARYVPILVYQRNSSGQTAKKAAATQLARLGQHGLKPLLDALADQNDPHQQRIAVSVLGYLGNRAAAPALVRVATTISANQPRLGTRIGRGPDWTFRVNALVAAGRLGDPRTLPQLTKLMNHREVAMREAATFALGMTAAIKAVPVLTAALADQRKSVRTLACLGLARIGSAKATRAIVAVLTSRQNPDATRAACAYAAGAIGDPTAIPALVATLRDGNDHPQRLSALALGKIGSQKATDDLIAAYFTKRGAVRQTVAWALSQTSTSETSGNRSGRKPMELLLEEFEYVLRYGKFDQKLAIESLGRLPAEPRPLPLVALAKRDQAIIQGLAHALKRHRDLVVRVLQDLNSRDSSIGLGLLTEGLDQLNSRNARLVETALARIGSTLGKDIASLISHRDPEVRQLALSVTAKLGKPQFRSNIEKGFRDPILSVQVAATQAAQTYFDRTQDPSIAVALIQMLRTAPNWQQRLAACRVLGAFHQEIRAVKALTQAVSTDKKAIIRACAAKALGEGKSSAAAKALIYATDAAHEPAPLVRIAAVASLGTFSTPEVLAALDHVALSDPDSKVRHAASAHRDHKPGKK